MKNENSFFMRPLFYKKIQIMQGNERILPPTPYESGADNLCGCLCFLLFVVEFIQILPYRNEENLESDGFNPSSNNPAVTTVVLHDPESAFRLDGTVHSEKDTMYAFQVLHDFMMHGGELPVDPDSAIFISLLTSFRSSLRRYRPLPDVRSCSPSHAGGTANGTPSHWDSA